VKGGLNFKTAVNAAYGSVDTISRPSINYSNDGNVYVIHREFLTDVTSSGSTDYAVLDTFIMNPANSNSFPWLSGIAPNFEKFCFEKLCLHFVTQSPTSSPGSVMIIPIYDVDAPIPATKSDALQLVDTVRSPAWQESCAMLPRDRLCNYKDYFVKIDPTDQKLSVPAKVTIAASGTSDSSPTTGEIWIEYAIRMKCPVSNTTLPTDLLVTQGANIAPIAHLFDQSIFTPGVYNTGTTYNTNVITLNKGIYLLWMYFANSDAGLDAISLTYGVGVTAPQGNTVDTVGYAFAWELLVVSGNSGTVTVNYGDTNISEFQMQLTSLNSFAP